MYDTVCNKGYARKSMAIVGLDHLQSRCGNESFHCSIDSLQAIRVPNKACDGRMYMTAFPLPCSFHVKAAEQ